MYMFIYKDEAHNTGNNCLQWYPIVFSVNTNISSNKILGKTSLQHPNSSMAFILLSHYIEYNFSQTRLFFCSWTM
jgi:hypothetical protein